MDKIQGAWYIVNIVYIVCHLVTYHVHVNDFVVIHDLVFGKLSYMLNGLSDSWVNKASK